MLDFQHILGKIVHVLTYAQSCDHIFTQSAVHQSIVLWVEFDLLTNGGIRKINRTLWVASALCLNF